MIDEEVPRTQRAQVAVKRAREIVSNNSEMIDGFLGDLPEFKDRQEPQSMALEEFKFDLEGGEEVIHQKIRTTNKYVTFFRDMLSQ